MQYGGNRQQSSLAQHAASSNNNTPLRNNYYYNSASSSATASPRSGYYGNNYSNNNNYNNNIYNTSPPLLQQTQQQEQNEEIAAPAQQQLHVSKFHFPYVFLVVACVCMSTLFFVILASYLIQGLFVYDMMFRASEKNSTSLFNECNFNNLPHMFLVNDTGCPIFNNLTVEKYFVSKEQWQHVYFRPTADAEWLRQDPSALLHGITFIHHDAAATKTNRPWVLTVHGFRGCVNDFDAMLPSTMLYHAGFNVFAIDVRNHGLSSINRANPYISFGHLEHLDVLSAINYLENELQQLTNMSRMGIFGSSMGGATSLIATAQDKRIVATFVDSPACMIYDTILFNAMQDFGFIAPLFISGACAISSWKSENKCPPFPNDPYWKVQEYTRENAVYFQHAKADLIVPFRLSQKCVIAANKTESQSSGGVKTGGARVYTHFEESATPIEYVRKDLCDNHSMLILSDVEAFRERLVSFFKRELKFDSLNIKNQK